MTGAKYGFDCDTCAVVTSIDEQSADIAMGVDKSLENKEGTDSELSNGAGDQGMMFGYACDETPELMPLPLSLAQKLCKRMAEVRKSGQVPYMRPDGKSQVTVEYDEHNRPVRVDTVVISTQHDPDVSPGADPEGHDRAGGQGRDPRGHAGREHKVLREPYRPFRQGRPGGGFRPHRPEDHRGYLRRQRPHGGGCFSGKDPTKVDRSAAYAARYVAKNIVAAGLARRCQVQLAYAIGVAQPVSVLVDTFGTGTVGDDRLETAVRKVFDLRPTAIIRDLDLRKPIYRKLAAYGHMGREDLGVTWEKTDRTEALKAAAEA